MKDTIPSTELLLLFDVLQASHFRLWLCQILLGINLLVLTASASIDLALIFSKFIYLITTWIDFGIFDLIDLMVDRSSWG